MIGKLNIRTFNLIRDKYNQSLSQLESWGILINQNSRLQKYSSDLDLLSSGALPSSPQQLCDLAFSLIEADELIEIVNSIDIPNAEISEKLSYLPKDPYKKASSGHTPGRNFQFELYMRALFVSAGFECKMGTPDLTIQINGHNLELEAKRPQKSKNIDKILRKAFKVLDSTNPGVILLALDNILFEGGKIVELKTEDSIEDAQKLVQNLTIEFLNTIKHRVIQQAKNYGSAHSILVLVKVPVYSNNLKEIFTIHHLQQVNFNDFVKIKPKVDLKQLDEDISQIWGQDSYSTGT